MLTTSAPSLAARGPVTECHGVQLRAQLRSVVVLDPALRKSLTSDGLRVVGSVGEAMRGIAGRLAARRALAELSV